jgi:hypothetical protein
MPANKGFTSANRAQKPAGDALHRIVAVHFEECRNKTSEDVGPQACGLPLSQLAYHVHLLVSTLIKSCCTQSVVVMIVILFVGELNLLVRNAHIPLRHPEISALPSRPRYATRRIPRLMCPIVNLTCHGEARKYE